MDYSNIQDPAVMEAVAQLMGQAVSSDAKMAALAEAVADVIRMTIDQENIVPLALTEHTLPKGQAARYGKRKGLKAFFVAVGGQPHEQAVNVDEEVEFPIFRVHTQPVIDISDLENGNLGSVTDLQADAKEAIIEKLNTHCMDLLMAGAQGENTNSDGGKLSAEALYAAITKIEDLGLKPRSIFMRGARGGDMHGWSLDDMGAKELREKGVLKAIAGAAIVKTPAMALSKVILIPNREVGKYAIRRKIAIDTQKSGFKVKFLTWQECAMGLTRPDLVFPVTIIG